MKKWLKEHCELFDRKWAFTMVLAGILILVILWPSGTSSSYLISGKTPDGKTASEADSESETKAMEQELLNIYIENQEKRLSDTLTSIEGAGQIKVMITARATKALVVEKDENYQTSIRTEENAGNDKQNINEQNKSESTVYTKNEAGEDIPYVIKTIEPEIEGVLVIAEGGGDMTTAAQITDAISVLFDVPLHKIKVVKMKAE